VIVSEDDCYRILGLSPFASDEEIKKAYREMAMRYHPDRNPDNPESEEKFKAINEAYALLNGLHGSQAYDRPHGEDDTFRDFDASTLFREFGLRFDEEIRQRFFSSGRRRGCGRRKARFFRGGFRGAPFGLRGDAVQDLPLTRTEALTGAEREILVQRGAQRERYLIRIPSGVTTGTMIRLPSENWETDQALYMRVRIVRDD
jgi:DnaJ-class molecular chaperone